MDIDDLIKRTQQGDREAFATLVRHFQRPLFGFLGNLGLAYARVEELAQETFWRAWSHIADYDPARAMFSTWLFTVARNLALNEMQRAAHRLETPAADDDDFPCDADQPQEVFERAQGRRLLHAALRELPVADRCVLALAYLKEMELADIARIENCSVGAVKTRLHRARARLAQLMEQTHV